ncbi:GATA transcription factor [Blastomyces dermatitidis ATCC 18188]|uniref:GATA transcription factor n=1 Tax=Ajellomyces dermatitidis (strain ATCC 18188 / CBS 674.68) TaxID=653446 RepID=F2TCS8_AJEDA|nr:GATA transcription factor [Blastomyces dermatitidis ATCC 18188]
MASEDGISVRQLRLKVLYTFDSENKTNCLARWPHLMDIQTAYIDEETQVGVIELKTCIQAIVSASPELVAKVGRDYTIYAYDYSEYETPLVGQGMLSWILASASPTPDAPAHQSKTMVTGRVCKNSFGLFSKGGQETLEVKLRLVPVPTIYQNEYLSSMHKYRESSHAMPQEFDAQSWTNFVQANPGLLAAGGSGSAPPPELAPSPVDRSGIERLHQMLSEGSTPREFSNITTAEPYHADSPAHSTHAAPSRTSTPGLTRPCSQHQKRPSGDAFRPSSRASGYDTDSRRQPTPYMGRRDSAFSGYGSNDEVTEAPAPKRAKLLRADSQDKAYMNIERQPGSLRVAASTAASVRIHRPMPMNAAAARAQTSNDDPVRPPTPIPRGTTGAARPIRPSLSNLRQESSSASQVPYTSPYAHPPETAVTSPEDVRYGSAIDTPFNMPSSPPVMENMYPQASSPLLPPLPDHDSGFMSGNLDSILDDNCIGNTLDDLETSASQVRQAPVNPGKEKPASPSQSVPQLHTNHNHCFPMSDSVVDTTANEPPPTLPPPPRRLTGSRPSSRASIRQNAKPLAPAPISQSEAERLNRQTIPASDPVRPALTSQQQTQAWNGPLSDFPTSTTPAPMPSDYGKVRSGAGARRTKQVQARLEQCIRQGTVPPYCENCGAIETPTWRRAWSKVIQGSAQDADSCADDPAMLFWRPEEFGPDGKTVIAFKQFKKSLADHDKDFVQLLLCNPCGLWLHKFKTMRPENKWNKQPPKDKGKRPIRRTKPLAGTSTTRSSRSKALASKRMGSSPGPMEASSPTGEDATTPGDTGNDTTAANDEDAPPPSRSVSRRANSEEPPKSADKRGNRWREEDAVKALHRAIQSSPARNMESRTLPFIEANLTPKPIRRSLFPASKDDNTMKTLSDASINVVRRSPRVASKQLKLTPTREGATARLDDGLDNLFVCSDAENDPLPFPGSPTPRQKNRRVMLTPTKQNNPASDSGNSMDGSKKQGTNSSPSRLTTEELERASREVSGQTPRAYRISNLLKDGTTQSSLQNSPRLRSFESLGGFVLDIFDSDEDSIAQADSFYPFIPPHYETENNWADWVAGTSISPRAAQSTDAAVGQAHGNDATLPSQRLGEGHTSTFKESDLLHLDLDDPVLTSLLLSDSNLNLHENLGDQPTTNDISNIFDMTIANSDLLSTQPQMSGCVEDLDATLASASTQEVNEKANEKANVNVDSAANAQEAS